MFYLSSKWLFLTSYGTVVWIFSLPRCYKNENLQKRHFDLHFKTCNLSSHFVQFLSKARLKGWNPFLSLRFSYPHMTQLPFPCPFPSFCSPASFSCLVPRFPPPSVKHNHLAFRHLRKVRAPHLRHALSASSCCSIYYISHKTEYSAPDKTPSAPFYIIKKHKMKRMQKFIHHIFLFLIIPEDKYP